MEYVDDKGTIKIVNEEGEQYPEKVQVLGKGKTMYIKVYPMKDSVNSEVFMYAENAVSVVVSPTVPAPFAASVPTNTNGYAKVSTPAAAGGSGVGDSVHDSQKKPVKTVIKKFS